MNYAHGGGIARIAGEYGIAAETLIDFSANVNPRGLPRRAAERLLRDAAAPAALAQYPDSNATELRGILSRRLDVAEDCIVIASGADALIHAAVRAFGRERCWVPRPAFCEYERAARACGYGVQSIWLDASANFALPRALPAMSPVDLLVLNNPHNPTGALTARAAMLDAIGRARTAGAAVLIDEAFIDYAPAASVTREAAAQPDAVVVRSLTKFFGCPGLRVGYAVAGPGTAQRIATQLPPWPVTTLALNAICEALQDAEYERESLASNEHARATLARSLEESGCQVFPAAANYLLVRLPEAWNAAAVRDTLIRKHAIVVRECDSFEGLERGRFLRIAVRSGEDNRRLIGAFHGISGHL